MHSNKIIILGVVCLGLAAFPPAKAEELESGKKTSWKLYAPELPKPAVASNPAIARDGRPDRPGSWSEGLPAGMERLSPSKQMDPDQARANAITGIAAWYEDDKGLEKDPAVVVFADFDDGRIRYKLTDDWCGTQWDSVSQTSREEPVSGNFCLVNRWPGPETGGTASRWFLEKLSGRDRPMYYMRLYHKFDENWYGDGKVFGMKGFGFVGYAVKCGSTVPCNGKNWFSAEMQWPGDGPSAKPGSYKGLLVQAHFYSFSTYLESVCPTMHDQLRINDNPGGKPFRFSAYTPPYTWIQLGEWYCLEVGILPNTAGKSDGEGCLWINGRLETRVTRMRYYDLEKAFKLYATINQYRTQTDNTKAKAVSRYVDNLVIARRYIGPIRFSKERLRYFRDNGIVVHGTEADDLNAMRRARAAKRSHP